ncbi:MAG: hypothetical protein AAGH40_14125, partial [Verrucomicrobiota bacterium]
LSQQKQDIITWKQHVAYLEGFLEKKSYNDIAKRLDVDSRLEAAKQKLAGVSSDKYLEELVGTIGRQPITE